MNDLKVNALCGSKQKLKRNQELPKALVHFVQKA